MDHVAVRGFGVSCATGVSRLTGFFEDVFRLQPESPSDKREYSKVRWPDPMTLIALRSVRRAFSVAGRSDEESRAVDVLVDTDGAGMESSQLFKTELETKGMRRANPTRYLSGLYNVPAATLAAELGLVGRTLTFCGWGDEKAEILAVASEWLAGDSEKVLVVSMRSGNFSRSDNSAPYACSFFLEAVSEKSASAYATLVASEADGRRCFSADRSSDLRVSSPLDESLVAIVEARARECIGHRFLHDLVVAEGE